MTRRLLGYVVKLPDGTRSPETAKPTEFGPAEKALLGFAPLGSYLVPVFGKPKPAPVVAAGGRYAVLCHGVVHGEAWFEDFDTVDDPTRHVGTREQAYRLKSLPRADAEVVRVLKDGEHEAALETARREERERISVLLATEAERLDIGCEEAGVHLRAAEIAKKGQAK